MWSWLFLAFSGGNSGFAERRARSKIDLGWRFRLYMCWDEMLFYVRRVCCPFLTPGAGLRMWLRSAQPPASLYPGLWAFSPIGETYPRNFL